MISTAVKCSDVRGFGYFSFETIRRSAASMTAAPLSILVERMSYAGQSTNDKERMRLMRYPHPRPLARPVVLLFGAYE